ncbi:FHA domain-containing protein, partial [Sulfuritalea sp.]|uniref:FHA domain-containing protein n=1 Tax=Sulfuritalea sp. TaxID=2480090 RepID=UPI001AC25C53
MPKLVDCTSGRARGEFPVNKERMVIGSKSANEVPLANLNADNEHAVIIRCGELYVIEDLGSATGTFVNERQIAKLLLSDGDVISIGHCQLRFVEEDAKAAAAPTGKERAPAPEAGKPAQ